MGGIVACHNGGQTMTLQDHAAQVATQFGPRAAAYVASPVHANGADLEQLAEIARTMPASARALDLGCGGGHASFHIAPHIGQTVAYDMSVDMLNAVSRTAADKGIGNIVTRQGVAEKLPFPDASFDLVVSRFSAHHWNDLEAGLAEARRVLKDAGRAVVIDVVAPASPLCDTHLQTIELLRDMSHVRNYSAATWASALAEAGFVISARTARRLRLDFTAWVTRMRTPDLYVGTIRGLQANMPREVADYLELEPDGSFTIDTLTIEARART
jgi:ubiquinone/menaquinone biosynthesis C-methylase UbiE